MGDGLQLLNEPRRLLRSCISVSAWHYVTARAGQHLRFFAVSKIEPRWCCSMRWRIWGVTSVPSHPMISICPMALGGCQQIAPIHELGI